MKRDATLRVSIVGTGRLARALAEGLSAAAWPIAAVAGRRRSPIDAIRRRTPGAVGTRSIERAATLADVILLAVSDRAIEAVAGELAEQDRSWSGKTVLHHAGVLGPEPLAPLRARGAAVGVFHPLQTIGSGPGQFERLAGARTRIEGDPAAVAVARRLARALGMVPLRLRRSLSQRDRVAYHAAASLVSNDLVALFATAVELLESLGTRRREAIAALAPLAAGAVRGLGETGVTGAITGPVIRGDSETLAAHLAELPRRSPDAATIHRSLSRVLLRIVEQESGDRLTRAERQRLRRLLGASGGGRGPGAGV